MAEDSDNALLSAGGPRSAPVYVNPAASMGRGMAIAGRAYELREKQAQEAIGNILQQATDENGNVDYQKAHKLAAAAGPVVQMGIMSMAKDASGLRGAQIGQAAGLHTLVGKMAASLIYDPSDANLDKIDAAAAAEGLPAGARAEIARIRALSPAQRQQEGLKHVGANLDALQQLHLSAGGTPATWETGNTIQGGTQNPVTGALQPSGGAIPKSMAPGAGGMVEATIQTPNGPVKVQIPYQQAFPGQVTPAAPGGGAAPVGGAGSSAPPPPPPGTTIKGGYQPRPVASPAPGTTPPPPSTPAVSSPVIQTPAGPAVVTSSPVGTEQDVTAYKAAQASMPDAKKNEAAGLAALEALRLARTGPGTDTSNKMKAFMIAQGIPGSGLIDTGGVEAYQNARKNLLRFAQSNGAKVGTDLGLSTQLESNPNVESLLNNVNDHILKQDLGLARQRIAQTLTAPGGGGTGKTEFGTGMGEHVQNFTAKTDPVAFAWDLLTPGERQEHLDKVKKTEGGMEKWERSMKIARSTGVWGMPTQQATPSPAVVAPRPAVAPPPVPAVRPNALVPTN